MLPSLSDRHVMIMGDFNYPNINWDTHDADAAGGLLLEVILNNFWTQYVSSATRGNNILDLVISSEETMIHNLSIDEHLANSDHNIVSFRLVIETEIKTNRQGRYDYNKTNYNQLLDSLKSLDWDKKLSNFSVEEMWCTFKEYLMHEANNCTPTVKNRAVRYPKWMTREARRARNYKYKMWKRFQGSQSYNDKIEYKRALNIATSTFRDAKRHFEVKLSRECKTNPKSFYAYVRSKSKTKDKVWPLKDNNGNLVVEDSKICNLLNDFFSSVFTQEDVNCTEQDFPILRNLFTGNLDDALNEVFVDEEDVKCRLKRLKINKAPGVDNIVPVLLVKTADVVCKPITIIFKASLGTCMVPLDWRRANVSAIYKQGQRDSPGNYRPISLTCQLCKVLESIIRDKITEHLDKFNLIKPSQHGFRKNRSCLTNLLEFLQFTRTNVDSGEAVDVIFLDFQKAFDKLPHKRLLLKLKAHGVRGNVSTWIAQWLKDREQRVVLNQGYSSWSKVRSGVPQGSVLGPLLFVIFLNDIDSSVVNKLSKFADDTKLYGVVSSQVQVDQLRLDLSGLLKWSRDWQMLFNLTKCKVMHFGSNNVRVGYAMDGVRLERVEEEKDLGVLVQEDLKVSNQCVKAVKAANCVLGMISRTFRYKTEVIVPLYKSLVRPHLEYCVQAWRPHLQKDINMLENVQKRAMRMADQINCTYLERIGMLGITTLETRRLRGDLIEVFKMFKGFDNLKLHDFFVLADGTSRGHSLKLYKNRFRTDVGKFSFANRVINEWNLLTQDIIACDTLEQFKVKLDRHLRLCRGFT